MTANTVDTAVNTKKSSADSTRMKQKKRVKSKCRQRRIMTSGLSSIIGLVDNSLGSQTSLFTEAQWSALQLLFEGRLRIDPVELKPRMLLLLSVKEIARSRCDTTIAALTILKAVLKVRKKYPYMLLKPPSKNVIESDYLRCIWSRIFEAVFPPKKNLIRIKSGESINSVSNVNKNEQYVGATSAKSSKVDLRLLVNVQEDKSDVGVGEYALNEAGVKAIYR